MSPGKLLMTLAMMARCGIAFEEEETPEDIEATDENLDTAIWLAMSWVGLIVSFMVYLAGISYVRYSRRIADQKDPTRSFFTKPNLVHGWFKRHLFNAPLLRSHHHREYKLFTLNMGYLPNRLQTILLVGYGAANVVFTFLFIEFSSDQALEDLRDRSGVLCVVNMLPLFVLAGRNNPLIYLTGISFDTFDLVHRWIGRIAILHAVTHTVVYIIHDVRDYGWSRVGNNISNDSFYTWSTVGLASFILIFFQAWSPTRHAFYEIFLHFHIFLTGVALAGIWVHCQTKDLFQLFLVQVALGVWRVERVLRLIWLGFRNFGGIEAEVEVLPGECLRIRLKVARPWRFKAGQHVYLYMPRIGWWTSHPFSLAWSEGDPSSEKEMCLERLDRSGLAKVSIGLLVRRRSGFTDALYRKAHAAPAGRFVTPALVEGPYGSQDLSSYASVTLVAAGVGIAHQLPQLRALVAARAKNEAAVRGVTLVWIVRSPADIAWIAPWLAEIMETPETRALAKVLVFATRASVVDQPSSLPRGVVVVPGRPDIEALVDDDLNQCIGGACAVSVCGTESLGDDVRAVVRARQGKWNIDFFEESFSW